MQLFLSKKTPFRDRFLSPISWWHLGSERSLTEDAHTQDSWGPSPDINRKQLMVKASGRAIFRLNRELWACSYKNCYPCWGETFGDVDTFVPMSNPLLKLLLMNSMTHQAIWVGEFLWSVICLMWWGYLVTSLQEKSQNTSDKCSPIIWDYVYKCLQELTRAFQLF